MTNFRIGIDLMGGDNSPHDVFSAVMDVLKEIKTPVNFVIFGLKNTFNSFKKVTSQHVHSIEFVETKEVINMDEEPLFAVRRKKQSSMFEGIRRLASKDLHAFISTGNTGALVAIASITLNSLPGIDRSALLASLPTKRGCVTVLDVGAHVSSTPKRFLQLARMGIAYQRCIFNVQSPTVGLLNIGEEECKGTKETCEAYNSLKAFYNDVEKTIFVGNVEGRDVFEGKVDVLVTDGFSGNVFLKASEGAIDFVIDRLQNVYPANRQVEKSLKLFDSIRYCSYPGAILCGVDGILVKCHGYSDAKSVIKSIHNVIHLIEVDFVEKMRSHLEVL